MNTPGFKLRAQPLCAEFEICCISALGCMLTYVLIYEFLNILCSISSVHTDMSHVSKPSPMYRATPYGHVHTC